MIVVGTQSGVVLTSEDQGKNWKRTALGNTSLVDMTVCGTLGFLAIDHYHKVWSADAEGKNWKSVALEMPRTPLAVTCDKQGGWWVTGINSVISGSADQGKTWKTTDFGEDTQITTIQFVDEKNGIALGEFGLVGLGRFGVAQLTDDAFELGQHLRRAVHDVDSLAAPLDLEHRARLELADVHFYRRAHGFCAGAGFPGSQERYGDEPAEEDQEREGDGGGELRALHT